MTWLMLYPFDPYYLHGKHTGKRHLFTALTYAALAC